MVNSLIYWNSSTPMAHPIIELVGAKIMVMTRGDH